MYAGPLSAVRAVMRDKNAESLPLPLTVRIKNGQHYFFFMFPHLQYLTSQLYISFSPTVI